MLKYLTKEDLVALKEYLNAIIIHLKNNEKRFFEAELFSAVYESLNALSGKLNAPVSYLSVSEACRCFGVDESLIDSAIKNGEIGCSRIGDIKMIRIKEFEAYIESSFSYESYDFFLDHTIYSSIFQN